MAPSDAHATDASEAHEHASIWPFVGATGMGVTFAGLVIHPILVVAGLAILFSGLGGWLHQDARGHAIGKVEGPLEEAPFAGISNRKMGMWLFLVSEVFFFSGIIGASLAVRARAGWFYPDWPLPGAVLNVPLTAANTFILITSSLTMVEALRAIELGNVKRCRALLLATLLLGITFLSIQVSEYRILFFEEHLTPWPTSLRPDLVAQNFATYGMAFYMQTGFHGAHVTGGVVAMAFLTIKTFRGKYTKDNHEAIELVGLYWHFVDVVWIFLFTIVYLI